MSWQRHAALLLLARWHPSENALLDWLSPQIDDEMLREIAEADYGVQTDEHFAALKAIRDKGDMSALQSWIPGEVLELMRWSRPEDPNWGRGSPGKQGHLIRAFCCAALLKAEGLREPQEQGAEETDTLARLVESCLVLGNEAAENVLRFLCWRVSRLSDENDDYPFFAFAVLLLRTTLFLPGEKGTELVALVDWTEFEEKRIREKQGDFVQTNEWLLGLTGSEQSHGIWRRITQQINVDNAFRLPRAPAVALQSLVHEMLYG